MCKIKPRMAVLCLMDKLQAVHSRLGLLATSLAAGLMLLMAKVRREIPEVLDFHWPTCVRCSVCNYWDGYYVNRCAFEEASDESKNFENFH